MRIRIIDAFTDRPFAGNPAGVCLLDAGTWPGTEWMRRIAAELSHEAAFAHPLPDGASADWALRWFTPAAESNLCGHATLATAHALHTDRATPLTVRFASQFGILIAHTRHDGTITLDVPAAFPAEAPTPDGLAQALGAKLGATYSTGALGDLLAVAGNEAAVRGLRPDFTALARLTRQNGIRGIIVTGTVAMTSSPGTSHQQAASPKTPSPAAPTPPWPPTGRTASAATASPACRPPTAQAWSIPPSTATGSTSPATRSPSWTAPWTKTRDKKDCQSALRCRPWPPRPRRHSAGSACRPAPGVTQAE
jgi:PhzF family phenazine biosynthesis protein